MINLLLLLPLITALEGVFALLITASLTLFVLGKRYPKKTG